MSAPWTLRRAARLGWLAARGASIDAIRTDPVIGANRTTQAIHRAAVALAKLRKLLAGAAAGAPVSDLVAAVFER